MTHSFTKAAAAALALSMILGLGACTNEVAAQSGDAAQSTEAPQSDAPIEVDRSGDANFPEVTDKNGIPTISAGEGDEPTVVSVKTLKEGDGREVGENDFVLVNYVGALWDGTVFDSSYERPVDSTQSGAQSGAAATETVPVAFSLNQVVKGWQAGLATQHVGDRVEIVIPSEYGYGDQSTGSIPANSTLVFVVDLLDAADPNDTSALDDAKAEDIELPSGVSLSGDIGKEPALAIAGSNGITKETELVAATGTGEAITKDDYIIYEGVMSAPGMGTQSTWATGATMAQPGVPQLVGKTVGSRVVILTPASQPDAAQSGVATQAVPASGIVTDITAVLRDRTK